MPRSGTNFLADALAKHPGIRRSPGDFWEYVPFRFQQQLKDYLDRIAASKHAHRFERDQFLPYVGDAWLRFLAPNLDPGETALFKEPSISDLGAMFRMYSECRAIVILRDGRDIVSSALKSDFALPGFSLWKRSQWRRLLPDEDFRILCRQYRDAAGALLRFLRSDDGECFGSRLMIVKYETLIDEPEKELTRILDWIGLSAEAFDWRGFQEMPIRGSSFLRGNDGRHDFGKGIARPKEGFDSKKRWADWTAKRLAFFDRMAGPFSSELGYE